MIKVIKNFNRLTKRSLNLHPWRYSTLDYPGVRAASMNLALL